MKRKDSQQTNSDEIVQEASEQQEAMNTDEGEVIQADFAAAEELITPQSELDQVRQELKETQERVLRGQADFDNFRRRTRQDKEEFAKYASSKVITGILPVVDNFERALSTSRETQDFDSLFKGVEMIFRQLEQLLEQEGVKSMDTVGQPFNPELHQAIMQVESAEHEEGIVVEEIVKGYVLRDKILRPAMVKVSS
ncbi:MAG: nucleotide exchange factor GrpE [Gorillibacterium sp.]|nr:nucleotide exchange factor GrpE [Gorillibacterium sp.]